MPESPEQLNVKKPQEDMEKKPEDLEMQPEERLETPEDLEKLAQEKIADINLIVENLDKDGQNRAKKIEKSIDVSEETPRNIEIKAETESSLAEIPPKAKTLLEEMKAKMKMAVAIGMATVAFSGAGGIKESEAGILVKAKENVATVGIDKAKQEKELLEKYEKAKKEAENYIRKTTEARTDIQGTATKKERRVVEKIKNELLVHISSQEYFNKLKSEFGGNNNRAKGEQARRIENLKKVNINIASSDELNEELKKRLNERKLPGNSIKSNGFYDPVSHETFVSFDDSRGALTNLHELLHASTRGVEGITYRTKNTLVNSYENQGFLGGLIKDKKDEYFSDPTERLVRKQILDRELNELGIKKYGEEFTKEHYREMMEAYEAGVFSYNVNDFIKRTKKDPKIFMEIFNKIAENETEKASTSSPV